MSEVKLNLIDTQTILSGTIHGSVADRCVAALSAEPETISELEATLARFERGDRNLHGFPCFYDKGYVDIQPYDAGIMIIDLAARIVACDSTYSRPGREGSVDYHDGYARPDIPIEYRLPDDWLFVRSVEEYEGICDERRELRAQPPLDARAILYGTPLLEFIARNVLADFSSGRLSEGATTAEPSDDDPTGLHETAKDIHIRWLLTPRDDLNGQSPRDLLLAKRDLIAFDLQSRELQWSMQLEAPPCLDRNSFAYRFAGFGHHEWVVYYYLVRHLIWTAIDVKMSESEDRRSAVERESSTLELGGSQEQELIAVLCEATVKWLNDEDPHFDGRRPADIIDNERRRLPEAMTGRTMVIDEDCPTCKMMGDEAEAGEAVYFWLLDDCNMDDDFAFSTFHTYEEWESDRREMEAALKPKVN